MSPTRLATILLIVLATPAGAQEVPGDVGIFLPVDAASASEFVGLAARSLTADPLVVRTRRVGLDLDALAPLTGVLDRGADLPIVRLNLFENVVIESPVESVDLTSVGIRLVWRRSWRPDGVGGRGDER